VPSGPAEAQGPASWRRSPFSPPRTQRAPCARREFSNYILHTFPRRGSHVQVEGILLWRRIVPGSSPAVERCPGGRAGDGLRPAAQLGSEQLAPEPGVRVDHRSRPPRAVDDLKHSAHRVTDAGYMRGTGNTHGLLGIPWRQDSGLAWATGTTSATGKTTRLRAMERGTPGGRRWPSGRSRPRDCARPT
jgi:hypothetical protein